MDDTSIDTRVFDNLYTSTGADPDFIVELIDTFCADAENLFAELETALAEDDPPAFRRAAHTLKSGSNSLGAIHLGRLCLEMEEMGKTGHLEDTRDTLGAANAEYAHVCAELSEKRQEFMR